MSSQTDIRDTMAPADDQGSHSGHELLELLFPYDILIRIFLLLTQGDLLSCSLVCKQYREAIFHSSIWAQILEDQWKRGRRCISRFETPMEEIRKDIIRALSAERNWRSQRPKFKSVQRLNLFQKRISKDHSFLTWQSNFISRRLYLPLENETLEYDIINEEIVSSLSFAPDIKLGGFCIFQNGNVHIFNATRSSTLNVDAQAGTSDSSMKTTLSILQLLPATSQSESELQRALKAVEKCAFDLSLDLRRSSTPFIRILNSRMLFCAFNCVSRIYFLIVFDWNSHQPFSAQLSSPEGMPPFPFNAPISTAHISRGSGGETLVIFFQSDVTVGFQLKYTMKYLWEVQRGTALPAPMEFLCCSQRKDVGWNKTHHDNANIRDLRGSTLVRVFTLANDYCFSSCGLASSKVDSVNKLESSFRFYKQTSSEYPAHRRWHIIHSYTRNNELLRRSADNHISLISPRLQAGENAVPISCLSINHVGWIEARESQSGNSNSARLVFMLVTLPEPLDEPLPMTIRELDIPNGVLQSATHAWMNSAMGTITIVTYNNRLNVYSY